jgi:hypothetical protein
MVDLYQEYETARAKPKLYRPPLAVDFNPKAWASAHMVDITGPYAYALNLPQIAECKPGNLLTSPMLEDLLPCTARIVPETVKDLESKMIADGLFYHDTPPKQGHVLGFFLKPATDSKPAELLYTRRDSNNQWSYREITEEGGCRKPYKPRQIDFNGQPVKDILKADFGRFTECLGFASIPYAGIEYYRRIVLPPADMRPFHRAVPAEIVLGIR